MDEIENACDGGASQQRAHHAEEKSRAGIAAKAQQPFRLLLLQVTLPV